MNQPNPKVVITEPQLLNAGGFLGYGKKIRYEKPGDGGLLHSLGLFKPHDFEPVDFYFIDIGAFLV